MEEEPRHIPIDPQEYLSFVENLERFRGQNISLEVHLFTLYIISRTIAALEVDHPDSVSVEDFLRALRNYAEYVMDQVQTASDASGVRAEIQNLVRMTEEWQRHFQARAGDMTDINPS